MKRYLCALLALALLCGAAMAEAEEPEIIAIEQITASEEGSEATAAPGEDSEEITAVDEAAEETPEVETTPEATLPPDTVKLDFEDGFSLQFPKGWLYHPVAEDMAEQGVVYCLSDAAGTGWLYIQNWDTDCADMDELKELIDRTTQLQTSGVYDFNGTGFVVYDLTEVDVSCCAAIVGGQVINLVFTPQSDADFMAVAAQILNTFEIL